MEKSLIENTHEKKLYISIITDFYSFSRRNECNSFVYFVLSIFIWTIFISLFIDFHIYMQKYFFCIEIIIRMDDSIDIYQDVSMLKLKRMNYIWFYF